MSFTQSHVSYTIQLATAASHTLNMTLHIPSPDRNGQVLSLPAWIPGSYMIRDFSKNIVRFNAVDEDGNNVEYQRIDKQSWKLAPCDAGVFVHYEIYAFDLSIRSAYICDQYAFFNGTSVFLKVHDQENDSYCVVIEYPQDNARKHWQIATAMQEDAVSRPGVAQFRANNYEELIDNPFLIGELDILPFHQSGVDFELVFAGDQHADTDRIIEDLKPICAHHIDLFDAPPPVSRYLFLTLLTDNGFEGWSTGTQQRCYTAVTTSLNNTKKTK